MPLNTANSKYGCLDEVSMPVLGLPPAPSTAPMGSLGRSMRRQHSITPKLPSKRHAYDHSRDGNSYHTNTRDHHTVPGNGQQNPLLSQSPDHIQDLYLQPDTPRRDHNIPQSSAASPSTTPAHGYNQIHYGSAESLALAVIESEVVARASFTLATLATPLVFLHNPKDYGPYEHPSLEDISQPNSGMHVLDPGMRINWAFLENENRLHELLAQVRRMHDAESEAIQNMEDRLYRELDRMSHEKELHWSQYRLPMNSPNFVNTGGLSAKINLYLTNNHCISRDLFQTTFPYESKYYGFVCYIRCHD
jgi:hypothetical protein